ncbi:MAG: hypothetical protein KAR79_05415 [Simkaniaceae bacterium]|nr:hypothetical protein [Simkaniaceae bacterium]
MAKYWDIWERVSSKLQMHDYIITKRPGIQNEDSRVDTILILNRKEVLYTLEKYYSDFREVFGEDFNPSSIINEVKDPNSFFWNTVLKHHAMLGILLGYGYMNSWIFHWKDRYAETTNNRGKFFKALPFQTVDDEKIQYPTVNNFPLPVFRFVDPKPIEKYRKERDLIQKKYSQGDFLTITIDQLCAHS